MTNNQLTLKRQFPLCAMALCEGEGGERDVIFKSLFNF